MPNNDDTTTVCRDSSKSRPCRWDRDAAGIHSALGDIRSTLAEIQSDMKVGHQRFKVLEGIVFGAAGFVALTFLGAVIAFFLNGRGTA